MRILGVDPGLTTGLSLIYDGRIMWESETKSLSFLWGLLDTMVPNVIVAESLIGNPTIDISYPLKAIGVCQLYAELNFIPMVYSNPSILQGKKKPRGLSPHIWSARVHALNYKE